MRTRATCPTSFVLVTDHRPFEIDPNRIGTLFLVDAEPSTITFPPVVGSIGVETGEPAQPVDIRTSLAIVVSVAVAVGLLEVALLAGAGFAVVARRRVRHYGLLAAVGATPGHLRRAASFGGLLVGLTGSLVGAAAGLAVARAIVPGFETAVGHRIDFRAPWWTVVPSIGLAASAATVAARWPVRSLAARPVAHNLAALRPRVGPTGGRSLAGLVLTAAGAAAMAAGVARPQRRSGPSPGPSCR